MLLNFYKSRSRGLGRPRSVVFMSAVVILMYYCLIKTEEIRVGRLSHVEYTPQARSGVGGSENAKNDGSNDSKTKAVSPTAKEVAPPVQVVTEPEKAVPQPQKAVPQLAVPENSQIPTSKLDPPKEDTLVQQAQLVQIEYETKYSATRDAPADTSIYGGTLAKLKYTNTRSRAHEDKLSPVKGGKLVNNEKPFSFDPYPNYNGKDWKSLHADHVPCDVPAAAVGENIHVFKGYPRDFPGPGFGSYGVLGIDENLCFERETRLGQYGLTSEIDESTEPIDWARLDWGDIQSQCVKKNGGRFESQHEPYRFVVPGLEVQSATKPEKEKSVGEDLRVSRRSNNQPGSDKMAKGVDDAKAPIKEARTAVLLRSYTGKNYTENDKLVIRSLVTELNLRTGGEYQVFLLIHVKAPYNLGEGDAHKSVIEHEVPREFWGITILWDDDSVSKMYPRLDEKASKVHNAQYLSVQKFIQEHREFDFVWNWEMDSRVVGHHYDIVAKLAEFSKKQPRRGLWERNERFYIQDVHGDYSTKFRKAIEVLYGDDTVWGPPAVAGVKPQGPKPPVAKPEQDNYEWGVGEEADLITLSPIFNPIESNWILRNQVWGFQAGNELPRRATIITQSRLSRRLLDLMHAENLEGHHVGSEMMPQTISLLHGLKAVYAPMPVFFNRPWTGTQLARWFNGGPKNESGGFGSAMGWGREGRFQGSTWYFRADPPQRLYNNWMGYEDTGVGGVEWEGVNGRPCLPGMILHPIKDVRPTEAGSSSKSDLPYR